MFDALRQLLAGIGGATHGAQAGKQLSKAQPASRAPIQYAQYMNPDGTGGGFGPSDPSALQVRPALQPRQGAGWNGLQQSTSFDGGLQGYNQDDLSNGIQGGVVNQGYIPLQNSNFVGNIQGGRQSGQPILSDILNRIR